MAADPREDQRSDQKEGDYGFSQVDAKGRTDADADPFLRSAPRRCCCKRDEGDRKDPIKYCERLYPYRDRGSSFGTGAIIAAEAPRRRRPRLSDNVSGRVQHRGGHGTAGLRAIYQLERLAASIRL